MDYSEKSFKFSRAWELIIMSEFLKENFMRISFI